MEGQEAAAMEGAGEDMMRQMMGEFGKMGEKEVREREADARTRSKGGSPAGLPRRRKRSCVFLVEVVLP